MSRRVRLVNAKWFHIVFVKKMSRQARLINTMFWVILYVVYSKEVRVHPFVRMISRFVKDVPRLALFSQHEI